MLLCSEQFVPRLRQLLQSFDLMVTSVPAGEPIPGSYWGDPEAGLIGGTLYVRQDTPVHSALHEACHYICMDMERRRGLHTNAGGDYMEENGVCYLQILLAGHLSNYGQATILREMDSWGYSFRLGSAQRWFVDDAEDAHAWLVNAGIINDSGLVRWRVRQ